MSSSAEAASRRVLVVKSRCPGRGRWGRAPAGGERTARGDAQADRERRPARQVISSGIREALDLIGLGDLELLHELLEDGDGFGRLLIETYVSSICNRPSSSPSGPRRIAEVLSGPSPWLSRRDSARCCGTVGSDLRSRPFHAIRGPVRSGSVEIAAADGHDGEVSVRFLARTRGRPPRPCRTAPGRVAVADVLPDDVGVGIRHDGGVPSSAAG
jgi:hypothetical protein